MIFLFEKWELDTELYELRCGGAPCKVEPQVFDLLLFLVRNRDRVVGKEEIVQAIWDGRIVSEATISTCLKGARQALGDDGRLQRLIRTVHGRGFRFVGEVTEGGKPVTQADLPVPDPPEAVLAEPAAAESARTNRAPRKPVIAVLPFDNLSGDLEEYFADGLTEDILTNLSRFRDILVVGRTSSFQYKGQRLHLTKVCEELGAGYVVEGSVRRAGGRLRITAQLIDGISGIHIWADSYDRDLEDIFAVQDEVTRTIAARLGVSLQDVAQQQAMKKSPTELDAYDCVLRARRYTHSLNRVLHAEARDLLERAVELDPNSADAAALLANVYLAEHRFDSNPKPDTLERSLEMAQRAVRLDPQNAYAHCWLAITHFFRGENDAFEAEANRALVLNPNDPETLADIGHYLTFMGQFDRGFALSKRARDLNPLHPGWYHFSFARYYYHYKEYEKSLAEMQMTSMSGFYWMHMLVAACQGQLGRPEAAQSLARVYEAKPDFSAQAELRKWNAEAADMEHILEGLRKAGLQDAA